MTSVNDDELNKRISTKICIEWNIKSKILML